MNLSAGSDARARACGLTGHSFWISFINFSYIDSLHSDLVGVDSQKRQSFEKSGVIAFDIVKMIDNFIEWQRR